MKFGPGRNRHGRDRRILILGGARSGKSTCAELFAKSGRELVTVIATAEPFDDDLRERIAAHRRSRPCEWTTIESPLDPDSAMSRVPSKETAIIDCMTVWWGNMLHHGHGEAEVLAHTERVITRMSERSGTTILVSNEVGQGIVPATELGRTYRDLLGRVNTRLARAVDRSILMVAGRYVDLRDIRELV